MYIAKYRNTHTPIKHIFIFIYHLSISLNVHRSITNEMNSIKKKKNTQAILGKQNEKYNTSEKECFTQNE